MNENHKRKCFFLELVGKPLSILLPPESSQPTTMPYRLKSSNSGSLRYTQSNTQTPVASRNFTPNPATPANTPQLSSQKTQPIPVSHDSQSFAASESVLNQSDSPKSIRSGSTSPSRRRPSVVPTSPARIHRRFANYKRKKKEKKKSLDFDFLFLFFFKTKNSSSSDNQSPSMRSSMDTEIADELISDSIPSLKFDNGKKHKQEILKTMISKY